MTPAALGASEKFVSCHYERSLGTSRSSRERIRVEMLETSELMSRRYVTPRSYVTSKRALPRCNFRRNKSLDSLRDFGLAGNVPPAFPRRHFDALAVTRIFDFHGNLTISNSCDVYRICDNNRITRFYLPSLIQSCPNHKTNFVLF